MKYDTIGTSHLRTRVRKRYLWENDSLIGQTCHDLLVSQ